MLKLIRALLAICIALSNQTIAFAQIEKALLGTWKFATDSCHETYTLRPDGTFMSTSGEEQRLGNYSVQRITVEPRTMFKVTRTNIRSNHKKDCDGHVSQKEGGTDVRYIGFNNPTLDEISVCIDFAATRCFGPLTLNR